MQKLLGVTAGILFIIHMQLAVSQQTVSDGAVGSPAAMAARLQKELEIQYPPAKTTPDGGDLVAAGAVLILQKDKLVMNKAYMSGGKLSPPIQNVYENGKIIQVGLMDVLTSVNSFLSALGGTESQSRSFSVGEKFWVTKITAQADAVIFQLLSDPINNARYHATLKFPYSDTTTAESILVLVGEVVTTDRPVVATAPVPVPRRATQTPVPSASNNAPDPNGMFEAANALAGQGNNVEAVRLLRKASDAGHVKATNALGYMYEEGRGVPQNFAEANKLYLKAMKRGDPDAMINRGVMIAKGRGSRPDAMQAYMHFLLAAAYAKDEETRAAANKLKDEVSTNLSEQQVSRGQTMADTFAKKEIK